MTGRRPSLVPRHVASKLLSLEPEGDNAMSRISIKMHWAHGMTMGAIRGLIGQGGRGGQERRV